MVNLISEAVNKTKINTVVLGGGVFMNVKANNLVSKIKKIKKLFIMPSSGDESLSLGAALHCYYENSKEKNFSKSFLNNLYLGFEYSKDEQGAIQNLLLKKEIYYL